MKTQPRDPLSRMGRLRQAIADGNTCVTKVNLSNGAIAKVASQIGMKLSYRKREDGQGFDVFVKSIKSQN